MSRGSSPTSSVRVTCGGLAPTSTMLMLSERWFTTQTSLFERAATATGSSPTGTEPTCASVPPWTSKISSRLSGVLTANRRRRRATAPAAAPGRSRRRRRTVPWRWARRRWRAPRGHRGWSSRWLYFASCVCLEARDEAVSGVLRPGTVSLPERCSQRRRGGAPPDGARPCRAPRRRRTAQAAKATRRNRTGDLLITNGLQDESTVTRDELSARKTTITKSRDHGGSS